MKRVLYLLPVAAFSTVAIFVDAQESDNFPPAQCMNQCELAGRCEQSGFDEFPDFDTAFMEIASNCQVEYLYAVEGLCLDGKRILSTGNGFTSLIRFYTANGDFEGLINQTDTMYSPCMGQSYWPRYLQCESPKVVSKICGIELEIGSEAFHNRWNE